MVANELKGSRKNYGVEIVQDFRSAFSFTMACEEGSMIEKRMPLLEKRILSALDELAYPDDMAEAIEQADTHLQAKSKVNSNSNQSRASSFATLNEVGDVVEVLIIYNMSYVAT